jgi:hypothetical protein
MRRLKQSMYFKFHNNSLMNGLFNEVMSCAINRSSEFQSMDETVKILSL